jgi:hypothetical protein
MVFKSSTSDLPLTSGHSDGDVLTIQSDGTINWEAGGSGTITTDLTLTGAGTSGSPLVLIPPLLL